MAWAEFAVRSDSPAIQPASAGVEHPPQKVPLDDDVES